MVASASSGPSSPATSPPRSALAVVVASRSANAATRAAATGRAWAGSSATWSRSRSSWARSARIRAVAASAPGTSDSVVRSWAARASESRQASGTETAIPPGISLAPSSRPQISAEMRSRSVTSTRPPSQVATISR